eukprot:snap_masked-scaffold_7-processed-gene-6.18-mRNA-1 protein AED:1.00 eAED:1.00 QI:0/-1/0/0/-1/1/1/0/125
MNRVLIHYDVASTHATIKNRRRGLMRGYCFENRESLHAKLKLIANKYRYFPRKPALVGRCRYYHFRKKSTRDTANGLPLHNKVGYLLVLADSFSRKMCLSNVKKPMCGNAVKVIPDSTFSVSLIK